MMKVLCANYRMIQPITEDTINFGACMFSKGGEGEIFKIT